MIINEEVYPIDGEVGSVDATYTHNLRNYYATNGSKPLADQSIYYSASTSGYANLTHGGLTCWSYYGAGRSGGHGYMYEPEMSEAETQILMLVYNTAAIPGGQNIWYFDNAEQFPDNPLSLKETRFAYNVPNNQFSQKYENLRPINGFKYYSLCAVPYIGYWNGSNGQTIEDAKTFFNRSDHATKTIMSVGIRIFSGSNGGRHLEAIKFAYAQEIGVPKISYEEDPENPDDPTKSWEIKGTFQVDELENAVNYIPYVAYSAGGGTHNLLPMLGITNSTPAINFKSQMYNGTGGFNIFHNSMSKFVNRNSVITLNPAGAGGSYTVYPGVKLTKADVLAMCATCGLMFSDSALVAQSLDLSEAHVDENIVNDDLYFPIIESDGLWQGRYVHGQDNLKAEQVVDNWNDDPNAPFTNGSSSFGGISGTGWGRDKTPKYSQPVNGMTNMYVVSSSTLIKLIENLNNSDEDVFNTILNNLKLNGDNPINSIVSVMHCPINLSGMTSGLSTSIRVGGNVFPDIKGNTVTKVNKDIKLGSAVIKGDPNEQNYLEYEPYKKYVAWIPYCNFIELEPSVIYNKTLSFYLSVELYSGTCEGRVEVDGALYKTVSGQFGTPCAIQGFDAAQYTNSMIQNIGKMVGGTAAALDGNIGRGIEGLVQGAMDTLFTPKTFETSGHSGAGNHNLSMPTKVVIFEYKAQDFTELYYGAESTYAQRNGVACNFSKKLSELSGYTQVNNPEIIIQTATADEVALIKEKLKSGVFI